MQDDERDQVATIEPVSRRTFLRISCTTLSGSMAASIAPGVAIAAAQALQADAYPTVDIAALDAIREDAPITFNYPDANSPAVLVRLRQSAAGGVGPNNAIVAYSMLCTHKGCPVAYRSDRKLLICPCHWSSFDPAKAGQIVIGQASQALPQIELRLNGRMVQAVGVTGLIYGRETNIL
jgi:arsenite oxidase small subunit